MNNSKELSQLHFPIGIVVRFRSNKHEGNTRFEGRCCLRSGKQDVTHAIYKSWKRRQMAPFHQVWCLGRCWLAVANTENNLIGTSNVSRNVYSPVEIVLAFNRTSQDDATTLNLHNNVIPGEFWQMAKFGLDRRATTGKVTTKAKAEGIAIVKAA